MPRSPRDRAQAPRLAPRGRVTMTFTRRRRAARGRPPRGGRRSDARSRALLVGDERRQRSCRHETRRPAPGSRRRRARRSGARPRPGAESPGRRPQRRAPPRRPNLQRQRSLPGLGQQLIRLEAAADLGAEPEPVEPTRRQHDRVEAALAALAQPRVDVPAQRLDRERRARARAAAHDGEPTPSRSACRPGARSRRRAHREDPRAADTRRRRGPGDRSRSCPSPSARQRRSGRRAAPPRAP